MASMAGPPGAQQTAFIDRLRLSLILLIVLEHASMAYAGSARLDPFDPLRSSWFVVDSTSDPRLQLVAAARIPLAIPLLFLISGLFFETSVQRWGWRALARRRALRLGLPLACIAIVLAPVMHSATWAMSWRALPLAELVWRLYFDKWQIGHGWYLWTLLVFTAATLTWRTLQPRCYHRLGSALCIALTRRGRIVIPLTLLLLAVSGHAISHLMIAHGPPWMWRLLSGPFTFVEPLVGVDALFFLFGVALGQCARRMPLSDLVRQQRGPGMAWAAIALLSLALLGIFGQDWRVRDFSGGPTGDPILDSIVAPVYCAAASMTLLAGFARAGDRRLPLLDHLAPASFAIYVLHLPVVVWTQYALVGTALPALAKAAIAAALSVILSLVLVQACRSLSRVGQSGWGRADRGLRLIPEVGGAR